MIEASLRKGFGIFRKELLDISRDKRALFISLLFPLLLFPLIFGLLENTVKSTEKKRAESFTVAAATNETSPALAFLGSMKGITVVRGEDPVEMLKSGKAALAFGTVLRKEYLDEAGETTMTEIRITSDNSRSHSISAAATASALLSAFGGTAEKQAAGESSVKISGATLYPSNVGESMLLYSILLPLLVLTFTSIGSTAVAADLGAGEKERLTIEPLLANPASPVEITAGKLAATVVTGCAGVLSFSAGLSISFLLNPGLLGIEDPVFTIPMSRFFLIIVQALLLVVVFSSAELFLSIFARSVKEAQILFIPLLMVCMACGYAVTTIDPGRGIPFFYHHIPVFNSALLVRELSLGLGNAGGVSVTFIWNALYAAGFFRASVSFFSGEKVLPRS